MEVVQESNQGLTQQGRGDADHCKGLNAVDGLQITEKIRGRRAGAMYFTVLKSN